MHLLISKSNSMGKRAIRLLIAQATEFFQRVGSILMSRYLRKLILKYTDSECTIIIVCYMAYD